MVDLGSRGCAVTRADGTLGCEPPHRRAGTGIVKPKFETKFKKRFRVGRLLGEGMSEVRVTRDVNLDRDVALKQPIAGRAQTAEENLRLLKEAQNTGRLDGHPNIVAVHEAGLNDAKNVYFTMALVTGKDLSTILEEQLESGDFDTHPTRTLFSNLQVFIKVCDAVAFAHDRDLIHLDLKPDNVRVGQFGAVYVLDWGVAVLASDLRDFPDSVEIAGTVNYMSPEQADADVGRLGPATDVFCLGAILYELLTSWAPYDVDLLEERFGRSWEEMDPERANEVLVDMARQCAIADPEVRTRGARRVHRRIANIAMRALEKDPARRYRSVIELKEEVESFLICGWQFDRRVYPAGSVILREGDVGDEAFIISDGTCRVTRAHGPTHKHLADLQTGDVFGEIAMFSGDPRSATVTALDEVTVLVVRKEDLIDEDGIGHWLQLFQAALTKRFTEKQRQAEALEDEVLRLRRQVAELTSKLGGG
jgi:serine/threonine-protein kinase